MKSLFGNSGEKEAVIFHSRKEDKFIQEGPGDSYISSQRGRELPLRSLFFKMKKKVNHRGRGGAPGAASLTSGGK